MTTGASKAAGLEGLAGAVLTSPESSADRALEAAELALREPRLRAEHCEQALRAIAAVLYARPSLAGAETVRGVASILRVPNLPDRIYVLAGEVLRFLLTTSAGHDAFAALIALLAEKDRHTAIYAVAVESLQHAAAWATGRLDPDALLPLLALEHLRAFRQRLAENVIEPCLYRLGDALTAATFDRFAQACAKETFFKYFCFYVASRPDFSPQVRDQARTPVAAGFRLHRQVQELLGGGVKRVLVMQNIKDGQGDEIVRCVPLMQALLDFHPQLEITLITGRPYLYAHPRLEPVPITDRTRIQEMLRGPIDAVIDFFERSVHEVNYDPDLEPLVEAAIEKSRPRLILSSTKGYNRFVYERCDLDSRPLAHELGLDCQRVDNTYETTFRLIAELGFPLRCGEGCPVSEPVLAGVPDAAAAWAALTAGNTQRRPVALLNPFGGLEPLKGYIGRTMGSLALEIRRLIHDGFYVVLLPNGTRWSTPGLMPQAISRLEPWEQGQVVIGPDPAGQSGAKADYTMRLFFSFMRFAGLIVSVEGWAIHAAYCLGRPYRILMLPYSHPAGWHPYAPTRNQRVVDDIPEEIEEKDGTPPLPAQPRKFILLFLLREIGRAGDTEAAPFLHGALRSEDRDIRLAAALSLRNFTTDVTPGDFANLLDDPSYRVRAAAAAALLDMPSASRTGAVSLRREHLEAYVKIGEEPRPWMAVLKLGDAARPALEAGLDDDDGVIRREAARMLRLLDLKPRWRKRRTGIGRRLARLFGTRRHAETKQREGTERPPGETVLILTPVKDASGCIDRYCRRISRLTYPHRLISLGFLEGDSQDSTFADLERCFPRLDEQFRRVRLWKKDFGYRVPTGVHRGADEIQVERRTILARSRNHLLFHALEDDDWVLWLDVDVIDYPCDIIERLLATGKEIVQPHCVLDYGGPTFDRNGWRDRGSLHLDDLRAGGELVELHAVGATMLMVRADLHRDGLVFPAFPYGMANPQVRGERGELETEGLGLMAWDMGHRCWGMPHLEIRHRRW